MRIELNTAHDLKCKMVGKHLVVTNSFWRKVRSFDQLQKKFFL
jgi:hypothetical protein